MLVREVSLLRVGDISSSFIWNSANFSDTLLLLLSDVVMRSRSERADLSPMRSDLDPTLLTNSDLELDLVVDLAEDRASAISSDMLSWEESSFVCWDMSVIKALEAEGRPLNEPRDIPDISAVVSFVLDSDDIDRSSRTSVTSRCREGWGDSLAISSTSWRE